MDKGYSITLARPLLDEPIGIPPLALGRPVIVSLSGFVGFSGIVTAFAVSDGMNVVRIHFNPILIGLAFVQNVVALVKDVNWTAQGYVLEINNDTLITYGSGGV
jgi:hypothetical protein